MTAPTEVKATVKRWANDPLAFVLEALFGLSRETWTPWTPGNERPLISPDGPELWQGQLLDEVRDAMTNGKRRFAIRAGHGVGKTTMEAWLVLWFLLFNRPVNVPITANSQDQLRDVVWKEIAHWHAKLPRFLHDMLDVRVERVEVKGASDSCFAVARTARPEKPEALQGFHCQTLVFVIEEASGIEDVIFEVASGALSEPDNWQFMFANPTRLSGAFHKAFHGSRHNWRTFHVPCSKSSRVSPEYAKTMAEEYGEDSNVYRVRVMGDFPLSEDDAVIPLDLVEAAVGRDIEPNKHLPVVWGLDVARFGDDTTALCKRRGNATLEPCKEWRKLDTMQVVGKIAVEYRQTPEGDRPVCINTDVIGLGAGVVDRGREIGLPMRAVNVGERPSTDVDRFMRQRDELWFLARDWLANRDCIMVRDDKLMSELVQPKYKTESSGKLKVESKDDMKARGLKSPNVADAFCLTFAGGEVAAFRRQRVAQHTYDPFDMDHEAMNRDLGRRENVHVYDPFEVD